MFIVQAFMYTHKLPTRFSHGARAVKFYDSRKGRASSRLYRHRGEGSYTYLRTRVAGNYWTDRRLLFLAGVV